MMLLPLLMLTLYGVIAGYMWHRNERADRTTVKLAFFPSILILIVGTYNYYG